jgi:hypothetical protein
VKRRTKFTLLPNFLRIIIVDYNRPYIVLSLITGFVILRASAARMQDDVLYNGMTSRFAWDDVLHWRDNV